MRNQPTQLQLLHWQAAVEIGGGLFRGVQKGDSAIGLETLVLFDDASLPKHLRSTMCLKPASLTADTVRKAIQTKREEYDRELARFERYAEKAASFVLRQFAEVQD